MLDFIAGVVVGLVAYKFGVTLPLLITKVKGFLAKKEVPAVDVTVPAAKPEPVPTVEETK